MHFNHILVTSDLSEDSVRAMDLAAYENIVEGTQVTLLNVVEDWEVPAHIYHYIPDPDTLEQYRKDLLKMAEEELEKLGKRGLEKADVTCKAILSSQPVAQEIADYARTNNCDLIVISSHGRGTLGDIVMGSVVQKVIRLAPCPVMVIPKSEEESSS